MSFRQQIKHLSSEKHRKLWYLYTFAVHILLILSIASHYLIFFGLEGTVAVTKANQISGSGAGVIEPGQSCQVKEGKKMHDGIVVSYGKKNTLPQ